MPGPYFEGQTPSVCGCYYPDVLRVCDEIVDGKGVRICDCINCGRFSFEFELQKCERGHALPPPDSVTSYDPEELNKIRNEEHERLRAL